MYRFFSVPLIGRLPYRVGLPQFDLSLHGALRKQRFDLLHAHSPFFAGRFALRLARQRGLPIVATFHSRCRDKLQNAISWHSLVDHAVARIVEFYAAADQVWVPTEAASLGKLRSSGRRFKMAFVGEGYAAKAMQRMAVKLDMAEDTLFVGVLRDRSALAACYAQTDCFLFPSLYDTCGLVVKEAAAFGVPSVLIEGSAAAEGVVGGINGFLAGNSAQAYARKLETILDFRELVTQVGETARQTLCASWKDAVQEVKERYLLLLRKCAKTAPGAVATGEREASGIRL